MFETRGESERILLLVQQPTSDLISSDSTVPIILLQQVDKLRKLENYLLTMVIALPPLSMLGWGGVHNQGTKLTGVGYIDCFRYGEHDKGIIVLCGC